MGPLASLEKVNQPKKVLVILGARSRFHQNGTHLRLSVDAKIRAIAAAQMYEEGGIDRIIISGGSTHGSHFPSEAELLRDHLVGIYHIPIEIISLESCSLDTQENLDNIQKFLTSSDEVSILSNKYHLERIQKILRIKGLSFKTIHAEECLSRRSQHTYSFIEMYQDSPFTLCKKLREKMALILLWIDFNGQLQKWLSRKRRG